MRFRATIVNVRLLMRLCNAVSKVQKECVLLVSPGTVKIIVETTISDGTSVWASMPTKALFDISTIKSATDNAIALRLNAELLEKAAKSGESAQTVTVRLRKRDSFPVLSFTAEIFAPQPITVTQDVRCIALGARAIEALAEPDIPQPDSAIFLPELKQFRNVIEHLSHIAEQLTLTVSSDGVFTLEASTPGVTVAATYNCVPFSFSNASSAASSVVSSAVPSQLDGASAAPPAAAAATGDDQVGTPPVSARRNFTATVAAPKLLKFLPCAGLKPERVMCCIVEQNSVVMHAVIGDVTVTYYIPVLCS